MIYLLSGPPGAGKGTQSDLLVQRMGFVKLSTGDALRAAVKAGTETGKMAAEIMNRGELVPDDVLFTIVCNTLRSTAKGKKVVLDGYPRTIRQAEDLDTLQDECPVIMFILLYIEDKASIARIADRLVCRQCNAVFNRTNHPPQKDGICDYCQTELVQRADDARDKVKKRLQVYREETEPLVDFYRRKDLLVKIVADCSEDELFSRLVLVIDRMCERG